MKKLLIVITLLFVCGIAHGATRTISDAGGNWSEVGTWVEGAVPTSADAVVAQGDGTSGNVVIDTTTCATSTMILTNYVGQMTFTTGQKLTVTTTVTFVAGMSFGAGQGTLQINNNATINSGGKTFPGNLAFDVGTFTLANNWTIQGDLVSNSGGADRLNANTLYVGGNITQGASGTFYGTTTIVMNGNGTWSAADSVAYMNNPLIFNTAGTIIIGANVYYRTSVLTYTSGTIDTTTNSSKLHNPATSLMLDTDGMNWYDIYMDYAGGSRTITLTGDLSCTHNFVVQPAVFPYEYIITTEGNYNISCANFYLERGMSWSQLSGTTLTVSDGLYLNGVSDLTMTMSAVTPTSHFHLDYNGTTDNCRVYEMTFTDVDASPSTQGIDNWYGGTLTNTTNITNRTSADIGGGGSGGGVSFFTMGN